MGNVIPKNRKAYGYDYADLGSVVNYVTEVLGIPRRTGHSLQQSSPISERVRVRRYPLLAGFQQVLERIRGTRSDHCWRFRWQT